MQTQTEISESTMNTKTEKTPVIYLAASVKNEVLNTLREGLSHLNAQVITEEDFENGLKKAHMVVLLNDDLSEIKKAWENGVIPITAKFDNSITDYNPNNESGNAFVFENANQWEIFAAVVRAVETFKFPYDWKFIVRSCKTGLV
ncbi:hypothetical protein ACFLZH_05655 [Patescibacteria group bacterium]